MAISEARFILLLLATIFVGVLTTASTIVCGAEPEASHAIDVAASLR